MTALRRRFKNAHCCNRLLIKSCLHKEKGPGVSRGLGDAIVMGSAEASGRRLITSPGQWCQPELQQGQLGPWWRRDQQWAR